MAINTVGGDPEEFPDFTHFWFIKPKPGDKIFKFYALLNGPSVTGAFEFESVPGEETLMTVSGSLFLRKVGETARPRAFLLDVLVRREHAPAPAWISARRCMTRTAC